MGDVDGKIAIMVDDIMDDVKTYVSAARVLKENGASMVYAMATHGILSRYVLFDQVSFLTYPCLPQGCSKHD